MLNESFATRDLLVELSASPRYWVLVLGKNPTRLFEGWRDTLLEVCAGGFPMTYPEAGQEKPLPVGYGIEKSKHRAQRERQFLCDVDAAFSRIGGAETLPLILIGTQRWLAYLEHVTRHSTRAAATLIGNHAKTPVRGLARLVWPLIQTHWVEQKLAWPGEMGKAQRAG